MWERKSNFELHEYDVLTHYCGVLTGSQYIVSINYMW
jgi:hypothetical protein